MNQVPVALLISVVLVGGVLAGCSDDPEAAAPDAEAIFADQQYYPLEQETYWLYRFDTTGTDMLTVKDAYRRKSTIRGTFNFDSLKYIVQVNETMYDSSTVEDTLYVRKGSEGLFATSVLLQGQDGIPGFPGLSLEIPNEIQLMPYPPQSGGTWEIFNVEYKIGFITLYFRAKATYMGMETVVTDYKTFHNCVRIRVLVEALLPNPEDPMNILNPLSIFEIGNFWFTKPGGLVQGEGKQIIFDLLDGRFPNLLDLPQRKIHQEVTGMQIVQPDGLCTFR